MFDPELSLLQNIAGLYCFFYFGAAFFLFLSGRTGVLLPLAVAILGVEGLMWFLLNADVLQYEQVEGFAPLAGTIGMLLLLVGAFRLAGFTPIWNKAQGNSTYFAATDTQMETLVIPRNATNSYTCAEELRDQLYQNVEDVSQKSGVTAVGYKSHAHSGTVWLRFDYLLPQDTENISLRASLKITVERFDYHRFEHTLTLEIVHGTKTKKKVGFIELVERDLEALTDYVRLGRTFPKLYSRRVRRWPFQLWLPRNKVAKLHPDWLLIGMAAGIVVSIMIPIIGWLFAICLVIGLVVYNWRRKTYILTTGKPLHDPRYLVRMDSWQTNIEQLGTRNSEVRDSVMERLLASAEKGIQVSPERIWYAGVDGKVEREQIVCTFRRAIGFVHLEPYGDDLYLGWDTHVNAGTWIEQTLTRGVDRKSGKLAVANRVVPGWQVPNEYDITDVNFLTEWLHGSVVRMLRLKMEEHKIDQEIDFTVQRESRKDALSATQPGEADTASNTANRFTSKLRRIN